MQRLIQNWRHGLALAWPLAKKDLLGRYRGSVVGLGWTLVTPLAMLLVYAAVFQGVFKARWAAGADVGGLGYATRLFAGLIVPPLVVLALGWLVGWAVSGFRRTA